MQAAPHKDLSCWWLLTVSLAVCHFDQGLLLASGGTVPVHSTAVPWSSCAGTCVSVLQKHAMFAARSILCWQP